MKAKIQFITLTQAVFIGIMLVFWIKFAYLGVLLTNVIQVAQATTLLTTQDLFVVRVVNVVLQFHTSFYMYLLNIFLAIPLGYVAMAGLSMVTPHKKWRRVNQVHCLVALGAQAAFLAGLAYMMNAFTTLARAVSIVHIIGWITCSVGLVIAGSCVYTLVRLMFAYNTSKKEEQADD